MQSRKHSALEVLTSTTVGFFGSWLVTFLVVRYVPSRDLAALLATIACTVWSIVRGYSLRRFFNGKL